MKIFTSKALVPSALVLLAMVCGQSVAAQDSESGKIEFSKTTDEAKEILERTRPVENKSIPTPKYVIKSQNNGFLLTIGGMINPILGYDLGNNLYQQGGAGISFVTSAIPVPATAGHRGDFYINPINGSVDMQVVGLANTKDEITGYVKVGTNGINSTVLLQRAYITWRGFVAGMKLTLMQDDYACQPPTIDPEGPSGCISNVAYEIAYKSKSYNGFRFAVGLDMPTFYSSNGYYRGHDYLKYDGEKFIGESEQLIPDVPAWIEYSFSQWNRVRLSGLLRTFAYRDLMSNKTRYTMGWGAMLSGNLSPSSKVIFYYQLAYGKGIGAYLQDIAGKPLSFVPENANPGHMVASPMMGVNFGITFQPTSKLQFNVMASESRIWKVGDYCNALDESQNYKYALYVAANCFYNITPYLQWGIEYLWGHRQTWNIGGAHDSRIQTQLAFTF